MKKTLAYFFKCLIIFTVLAAVFSTAFFIVRKTDIFSGVPRVVAQYNADGFFYKHLKTENEKKAYDLIMSEIYDFPKKIIIPDLSDSELDNVYEAMLYDNVDLFFLKGSCSTKNDGLKNYFYPEYQMNQEEYLRQTAALENMENLIVSQAPSGDEFELELFLHDTLIKRCTYSYDVTAQSSSPYACLIDGHASCEGYAKEMKRLLDLCGIECFLALGEAPDNDKVSTVGHMWDIVKINGKYYHLDPTWNDNNNDNSRLTYSYFNDNDDLIQRTHIVQPRFLGICESVDENYFTKTSAVFSSYDESSKNAVSTLLAKNADKGISLAPFMFDNEQAYQNAKKELFDNEQIYRLLDRADIFSQKKIITNQVKYWPDDTFYIITIFDYFQ